MRKSTQRIWAMILRNLYLLRSSWPRALELAYWPTFSLLIWGFLSQFLMNNSSYIAQAAGVLISAVLLWDVLFRSNLGLAVTFLEEMWSRNLGQLFISPLRPLELVASLMAISFLRTLISVVPAALLAMPLFGVWVFDLGIALAAFFFCLLAMGWAVGLFCTGLLLRMGLGAEGIVWTGIFIIAPITGIYYPVSVLPAWLHPIAWSIPSTYVFEGMRSVMFEHVFRWDLLMGAIALDVVYLAAGTASFLIFYRIARVRGLLLQQGD
jgi:ABC-2 type transport system permease protein